MVTGRALLKVKMRKGTQYCSITRNTEKSSISDDHPTLHIGIPFCGFLDDDGMHPIPYSFLPGQGAKMNDRKRDPATATCQETCQGQAFQRHPQSTKKAATMFVCSL